MLFVDAAKNTMLGALTIDCLSLHTDIPNSSGSNEVSGGSYARLTVAFGSASAGARSMTTSNPAFNVPAGTTAIFIGFWSNTGPTFHGFAPANGATVLGVGSVTASTDTVASYGHGLANGDRVLVKSILGETLPSPLSASTLYYVVGSATNSFQLSTTLGGSAVNVTVDGEFEWVRVLPEVFTSAGTYTVSSASVDLNG